MVKNQVRLPFSFFGESLTKERKMAAVAVHLGINPLSVTQALKSLSKGGWKSEKIRIVGTQIVKNDFTDLKKALEDHPNAKSLEICLCECPQQEIVDFAMEMPSFSLVGLQMVHLRVDDDTATALASAVQQCPLKKLDLAYNLITSVGAKAFAMALQDCGLESLLLGRNSIEEEGTKYIAKVLAKGLTNLRTLDLSRNGIKDEGLFALAEALPLSRLDTLLVDQNALTFAGLERLCLALPESPQLLNLSIGNNTALENKGIILLAETLKFTNLERLSVQACGFDDQGLAKLAEEVGKSPTMELLDISSNNLITDTGLSKLMECLKTHRTMHTIKMNTNNSRTSLGKRKQVEELMVRLHSKESKSLVALCSVRKVERVGYKSDLQMLPVELMRSVMRMLTNS